MQEIIFQHDIYYTKHWNEIFEGILFFRMALIDYFCKFWGINMKKLIFILNIFVICMAANAVNITTYIEAKEDFLNTTNAIQATDAYSGGAGVSSHTISGAFGDIIFRTLTGNLYFNTDRTTTLPGNDLAISGLESFEATLPVFVYSFGIDMYDSSEIPLHFK